MRDPALAPLVVLLSGCAAGSPAPSTETEAAGSRPSPSARAEVAAPVEVQPSASSPSAAPPSLSPPPLAVVVREGAGRCFYEEPAHTEHVVACPPAGEWLTIDVQEGLHGAVVIMVDGATVFSEPSVQPVAITGLVAHVRARPKQWPAVVDVRGTHAAHVSVPHATPYLALHGPNVTATLSATAFGYE
jgi:hypothetical protein